jgi:hypothetical protein
MSSLWDLGIAGALAISGTLMAPLRAWTVAAVLAGAMMFSIVLDAIKQVTFKCLKIACRDCPIHKPHGTPGAAY